MRPTPSCHLSGMFTSRKRRVPVGRLCRKHTESALQSAETRRLAEAGALEERLAAQAQEAAAGDDALREEQQQSANLRTFSQHPLSFRCSSRIRFGPLLERLPWRGRR